METTTYLHSQADELQKQNDRLTELLTRNSKTIANIIDKLSEDEWYSDSIEKEEILSDLCEIVDFQPVKEIYFRGTIAVEGRAEIPLGEEFDLNDMEFSVDVHNINAMVDEYYLNEIEES